MPDPPSGEENLRELRLKEADWIRADIEHERGLIERYYGFYLASLYFLIGWVVTSVIGQMSANQADAAVAELRKRPDMAIAISLIPALNTIFWVLLRGSSYRYVMLIFHLRQVGRIWRPVASPALSGIGRWPSTPNRRPCSGIPRSASWSS